MSSFFWTKTEPIRTDPNRSESGPVRTGSDQFGPVRTGLDFQKMHTSPTIFHQKSADNFFWKKVVSNIFSTRLSITFFSDLIKKNYKKKYQG